MKHLILSLSAGIVISARAFAFDLTGTIYETAGAEFDIDPVLLYSVALVESAADTEDGSDTISPYPWTLRSDKPFYGKTRKEAEAELARILKRGSSVDVGLMQVNTRWHGHRVKNPADLLDPLTNVRTGAAILSERLRATPKDAIKAIATYHSFDPDRGEWYARHVLRVWSRLKKLESK